MVQKTIWKIFLITGISITFALGFTCCTKTVDNIKTVDYIYKNRSGVNLILEVYNSNDNMFKTFEILNDNETKTNTTTLEVPVPFSFSGSGNMIGDSIVVRFPDSKCLYYSRNSGVDVYGDKIFDVREYDNYSSELLEKNQFTLYYTITEEDYNNSESCN